MEILNPIHFAKDNITNSYLAVSDRATVTS